MARARTEDKIRALSAVKLFSTCTKRELQQVAQLCTPLSVDEGFVLTLEGGIGNQCFVIASGEAAVRIGGRRVGVVGAGECVGEMALLDSGPRTATVTAEKPMDLFVLSTREFQDMLGVNADISRRIAISLAQRLRAYESRP
jgi:CRP-like cAMP-binding protein